MTATKQPSASSVIAMPEQRVVQVQDLSVRFATSERVVDAVRNLSFHVDRGETLAVVGESGSGKSVTSLALMRLVEHGGGKIVAGHMHLRRRNGQMLDLVNASQAAMRGVRGADIAMIFQEPMTSLNPVFTVGEQIAESIRLHQGKSASEAKAEVLRMLELVRIPEARRVLERYPHQLSGGMRKRVSLAQTFINGPQILLMDEPCSALDPTSTRVIEETMTELRKEVTIVIVTHNMQQAGRVSDRTGFFLHGELVEYGPTEEMFTRPKDPRTEAYITGRFG
ncbi:MAG TPA: hypothetical protein DGR79_00725 [Clostridiales bacterium]|nr:hypothetical protein [Clostridiales bacterium]